MNKNTEELMIHLLNELNLNLQQNNNLLLKIENSLQTNSTLNKTDNVDQKSDTAKINLDLSVHSGQVNNYFECSLIKNKIKKKTKTENKSRKD
jgi:hypothetical protein